ncbi:immunodominant staphylococcal antigen IsaB family protein [Macrococcoides caseolyticum]|uniref:immunodominant staphylococcal antigen IsaB family protein n=1 Tax=Macrococcoides caseolyticum TaxID=69966 RepID=UPI001F47AC0D|nr:hypothetical protein [Macrococcus caseolyticus]MCE4957392.1 hypothetical protein [Macrococcus caseolyticus]
MKKHFKLLSATGLSAALLLSANTINPDASFAQSTKVQATQLDTKPTGRTLDKSKPYYYYNGYFADNSQDILSKTFVQAVNNDNVMIDGYMKNKNISDKAIGGAAFYSHDTLINKSDSKTITGLTLKIGDKKIPSSAFNKAYKDLKRVKTIQSKDGTEVTNTYKTKANTKVQAHFVKGYLQLLTI